MEIYVIDIQEMPIAKTIQVFFLICHIDADSVHFVQVINTTV